MQAQFEGRLIYRRKRYPVELRSTLEHAAVLRIKADYSEDLVNQDKANRVLRRARIFVDTIRRGGRET